MKQTGIFYGYWIVLVGFLCLFVYSGVGYYALSVFYRPLELEFGWGRGQISWAFTIVFGIQGLAAPFVGRLVDRSGARLFIAIGALVTGLGLIWLYFIDNLWSYYLAYAVVGLGNVGISPIPVTKLLSSWFDRRRGFAIGFASVGIGLGGFAIAQPLGAFIIPALGWRLSFLSLGVLSWVLIIPAALFIVKSRPEDRGLAPDGTPVTKSSSSPVTARLFADSWTLKAAAATLSFWLILVGFVFSTYSHTSIILHQVNFLTDSGFNVVAASSAMGFVALGSAFGKFIFGWLCDHIPPKFVAAIAFSLIAIGVMVLLNVRPSSPVFMIWLYVVPLGLGMGGWLPTLSMITSRTFGLAYYGALFGAFSMAMNLGVAFGPTIAGYMYDSMQTYLGVFILLLVLLVISVTSMVLVRSPVRPADDRI